MSNLATAFGFHYEQGAKFTDGSRQVENLAGRQ